MIHFKYLPKLITSLFIILRVRRQHRWSFSIIPPNATFLLNLPKSLSVLWQQENPAFQFNQLVWKVRQEGDFKLDE